MEIGKEIPKRDFKKWMKALRSGEYKQAKYRLQGQYGYCCLGVACEILIPEKQKIKRSEEDYYYNSSQKGKLYGDTPDEQYNSPKWLKDISCDLNDKIGIELIELNDDMDLTFDEIADVLEEVYLNKTLDWGYYV